MHEDAEYRFKQTHIKLTYRTIKNNVSVWAFGVKQVFNNKRNQHNRLVCSDMRQEAKEWNSPGCFSLLNLNINDPACVTVHRKNSLNSELDSGSGPPFTNNFKYLSFGCSLSVTVYLLRLSLLNLTHIVSDHRAWVLNQLWVWFWPCSQSVVWLWDLDSLQCFL